MSFLAGHPALVNLMIIPCQVKKTMKNQDANFILKAMSKFACIPGGNVNGDGEIASEPIRYLANRGKRDNVGGLILAAETAIQLPHLAAGREQQADLGFHSDRLSRCHGKSQERALVHSFYLFVDRDQSCVLKENGRIARTTSRIV